MKRIADNPIFVIGAHKSGSSFLRNLLDGHSQLTTIPVEAHFFKHAGYWIDYNFRRQLKSNQTFAASAEAELHEYSQQLNPYSDFVLPEGRAFDETAFAAMLEDYEKVTTERELADLYFNALITAFGLEAHSASAKLRLCEKSVENAEFVPDLKRLYPDAHFIHIVRNPYNTVASFRRYRQKVEHRYPRLDRILMSVRNNYYNLERNQRNIENYTVVRYEDLKNRRRETMESLCQATGLHFEDTLLKPTVMGLPWGGNSTKKKATSDLTDLERYYVNRLFKNVLRKYDYPAHAKGSFWKRQRGERPSNYLLNRALRYQL